jgi:hypothetical protein
MAPPEHPDPPPSERVITHLAFWTAALGAIARGRGATLSYTVFGFPPLTDRPVRD